LRPLRASFSAVVQRFKELVASPRLRAAPSRTKLCWDGKPSAKPWPEPSGTKGVSGQGVRQLAGNRP